MAGAVVDDPVDGARGAVWLDGQALINEPAERDDPGGLLDAVKQLGVVIGADDGLVRAQPLALEGCVRRDPTNPRGTPPQPGRIVPGERDRAPATASLATRACGASPKRKRDWIACGSRKSSVVCAVGNELGTATLLS